LFRFPSRFTFLSRSPAWSRIGRSVARLCVRRARSTRETHGTGFAHTRHGFAPCLPEPFLRSLLKVREQLSVVVAVSEMNVQHRDAPVVFHLRIEFDEVLFLRQHLAARNPNSRLRDIAALDFLLPCRSVTGKRRGEPG